jgi:mRNA interferase RelE/StbE
MRKIDLSNQAISFLQKLPTKHAKQIGAKLLLLREVDTTLQSEEIKGKPPFRRVKSGEYRIIYLETDHTIFVSLIGKRNDDDIYKKLMR